MHRIYLDAGRSDEYYLDLGAQAFAAELDKLDVPYTLELFDGTHARLTYRYPGAIRELVTALAAYAARAHASTAGHGPKPASGLMWPVPGQHVAGAVERDRALRAVRVVVRAHQPRVLHRHRRRREERAAAPPARPPPTAARPAARARRACRRRPRGASTAGTRASGRARPAARRSRPARPPARRATRPAAGGRRRAGPGSGPSRRRTAAAPPARSASGRGRSPGSRGGSGTRGAPCRPLPYPNVVHSLDVSSLRCPMTWVRTKLELERLESGETLEVTVPPGEAETNVPRSAREAGHAVVVDGTHDPDRAPMSDASSRRGFLREIAAAAARRIPDQPRAFAPPPRPEPLLSDAEMERYSRQLVLPEWSEDGAARAARRQRARDRRRRARLAGRAVPRRRRRRPARDRRLRRRRGLEPAPPAAALHARHGRLARPSPPPPSCAS